MQFPKGTRFTNWVIVFEKQKNREDIPVIRRWAVFEDGKRYLQRLPVNRYRSIRTDLEELKQFIIRLNQEIPIEQRTIKTVEIRHAYISPALLDSYKAFLSAQITSKKRVNHEYSNLMSYFLGFFINKLNIPDPIVWHKIHRTEWANYLLSDEVPKSTKSKKEIISAANRFVFWLHERRPEEVPPLIFAPLSPAKFKEIEAVRKMKGESHIPKYIKDKDWIEIERNLIEEIKFPVLISYHYGLRRAEALGLKASDIKKGHLLIERQVIAYSDGKSKYGPLKGREIWRKVPHWFCNAESVYKWITSTIHMHPDTLTAKWVEFMNVMKMDYTLHDLRHTWITKAMRKHVPRDVQLASGHKNINTTMGYLHDDRNMEDEEYKPESA